MNPIMQQNKDRETPRQSDVRLPAVPKDLAALDGGVDKATEDALPTLGEVGKRFPIGFVDQTGGKHLDFDLVEWTYEVEERLGELASTEDKMPLNVYISELIGHGLARVGSIDVTKMKRSERRLLVRSMYFSDALYVYVWIRLAAIGNELKLNAFPCDACGRDIEGFTADLRTIGVKVFPNGVPNKTVKLERGVEYAGKRLTEITVGPVRWAFAETGEPSSFTNQAKLKLLTLQHGIIGIKGAPEGPVYLTAEHLRSMLPREINVLVTEIDQCNGGPAMDIRDTCPHCRRTFKQTIRWSYENFFALSSR
jgi:hypothetical protein